MIDNVYSIAMDNLYTINCPELRHLVLHSFRVLFMPVTYDTQIKMLTFV